MPHLHFFLSQPSLFFSSLFPHDFFFFSADKREQEAVENEAWTGGWAVRWQQAQVGLAATTVLEAAIKRTGWAESLAVSATARTAVRAGVSSGYGLGSLAVVDFGLMMVCEDHGGLMVVL
jgi:hypothetical protein